MSAVPAPAGGLRLLGPLQGSGYRDPPGLARRVDGQTLQLTSLVYAVLEAIDGTRDPVAIASAVSARVGREVSADDVEFLVEQKLRPLGLLRRADGLEPQIRKRNPLLSIRGRFTLAGPRLTNALAAPLTVVFHPAVVVGTLAAFVGAVWWVIVRHGLADPTRELLYDPKLVLALLGLTIASAAFHELGHAAACRAGGALPGRMGAGLYLVWPVFFTDVTDSYRLERRGRLRVDLGGLYFNAMFAVLAWAAWWVTGLDALLLLVVLQCIQMVHQLLPLVRLDGYHILADVTGVPDLFGRVGPTLRSLIPGVRPSPAARQLKPWVRVVITAWVLVVVPVLAFMIGAAVFALPRVAATTWDSLSMRWATVRWEWGHAHLATVVLGLVSMVALALPLAGTVYLLTRIASTSARTAWTRTDGRPRARALAVGAMAVVVLLLARAWWPAGQYQPIGVTERGTVLDGLSAVVDGVRHPRASTVSVVRAETSSARPPSPAPSPSPARSPSSAARMTAAAPAGVSMPRPRLVVVKSSSPSQQQLANALSFAFAHTRTVTVVVGPQEMNQAVVVNRTNGATIVSIAYSVVVDADGRVEARNQADARASCIDCTTITVAFQLVLIVGQADVIAPVNTSVAYTEHCLLCHAFAYAGQLVLRVEQIPDADTLARLLAASAPLVALGNDVQSNTLNQIPVTMDQVRQAVTAILGPTVTLVLPPASSGTSAGAPAAATAPAGTPPTTAVPSPGATTEPSTTTTTPPTTTTTIAAADPSTTAPTAAPTTAPTPPPTTTTTTTTTAPPTTTATATATTTATATATAP